MDETTYRLRIECGNCYSRANYDIERSLAANDAILVCPNCGCSPNGQNFSVVVDNGLSQSVKIESVPVKKPK